MSCPRIAITAGEPAGIGPDIVASIAEHPCRAQRIYIGCPALLSERARSLGLAIKPYTFDPNLAAKPQQAGEIAVLEVKLTTPVVAGHLSTANASYVLKTLEIACDGCVDSIFDAMVTAPVQKSIINDAGIAFSGHTEFLAERTGTHKVVMMLATDTLRVALATTHLPLAAVPKAITQESLHQTLTITHQALQQRFGIANPCIAVLGLNPHAGEGGHLGREEIDTIIPALNALRSDGLNVIGPLPADTAFNPDLLASADTVFAMYHDQGLPVLKYAGFGKAINITLGLPIIRTSVDHGTALDLAGSGNAKSDSLQAALDSAITLCEHSL